MIKNLVVIKICGICIYRILLYQNSIYILVCSKTASFIVILSFSCLIDKPISFSLDSGSSSLIFQGHVDIELNEDGRQQAAAVSHNFI